MAFLQNCHGIQLRVRQLKRILKTKGLRRRGHASALPDVLNAVQQELAGSGSLVGYRQMHQRLTIDHGLIIDRESVRLILKDLDPEGVEHRSRRTFQRRLYSTKGPNFLWHLDGYDKLKPFGFPIHGCIDGFSRRLLWSCVAHSNNDPKVIASFYMSYIKEINGVPRVVRGDRGNENVHVAGLQRFLRRNCADDMAGNKSFLYGIIYCVKTHHAPHPKKIWEVSATYLYSIYISSHRSLCNSCYAFEFGNRKKIIIHRQYYYIPPFYFCSCLPTLCTLS